VRCSSYDEAKLPSSLSANQTTACWHPIDKAALPSGVACPNPDCTMVLDPANYFHAHWSTYALLAVGSVFSVGGVFAAVVVGVAEVVKKPATE